MAAFETTISREKLKAKMDRGDDLVLIEVLPEMMYRQAHLPGAVRFPDLNSVVEAVTDKDALVVTYCSNEP